jgi:hypothetical protein
MTGIFATLDAECAGKETTAGNEIGSCATFELDDSGDHFVAVFAVDYLGGSGSRFRVLSVYVYYRLYLQFLRRRIHHRLHHRLLNRVLVWNLSILVHLLPLHRVVLLNVIPLLRILVRRVVINILMEIVLVKVLVLIIVRLIHVVIH